MGALKDKQTGPRPDTRFQHVKMNIFNPKAISMGELYGEVNMLS